MEIIGEVEVVDEVALAPTALLREGLVEADGDLTIKVHTFFYDLGGLKGKYAGVFGQAVVDDTTSYVYLDENALLVVSTGGFPSSSVLHLRLARVVTSGGYIYRTISERAFFGTATQQPSNMVVAQVRNETGVTIAKGMLLYVSGYSIAHSRYLVGVADKDDAAKRPAIAIAQADIPDASNASALVVGILSGIDTSALLLTDQLVLGNAGALLRPPPGESPFTGEVQNVGSVTRVHATLGEVVLSIDGIEVVTGPQVFALAGTSGTPGPTNKYVTDADPRNTNARTPTAHATSHKHGGSDEVAVAAAAANAIPKAGAGGTLAAGWIDDTAHGTRGGGTQHALATVSVAGFMSAADKAALNGLSATNNAAVQAKRTTTYALTTSFVDVTLNTTDVENNTAIVEHSNTLTDRLVVHETGLYWVYFKVETDYENGATSVDNTLHAQVRKNDTTVLSGSEAHCGNHYSGSAAFGEDPYVATGFLVTLTAEDFLSLQLSYGGPGAPATFNAVNVTFGAIRLKGTKGDTGAQGPSGAGVTVQTQFAEVTTDVTTTATGATWADLLTVAITVGSGASLIVQASTSSSNNGNDQPNNFRILIDGTAQRGYSSGSKAVAGEEVAGAIVLKRAVSSGARTVKLQWQVDAASTASILAATNPNQAHGSLLVSEVVG